MELTSLRLSPLPGSKERLHPGSADCAANVISRGTLRDHIIDGETKAQAEKGLAEATQAISDRAGT